MSYLYLFFRGFAIFGFFFMMVLAFGQLVVKNKKLINWSFIGLYGSLTILNLVSLNVQQDLFLLFPHLSLADMPFLAMTGPFVYMIFRETVPVEGKKKLYWIHFIIPLIILLIMLPYYMDSADYKYDHVVRLFINKELLIQGVLYGIALIIAFIYFFSVVVMALWGMSFHIIKSEESIHQVIMMIILSIFSILAALVAIITREHIFFRISISIVNGGVCMIFIMSHRIPNLYNNFADVVIATKQKQAHLDGLDIDEIYKKLIDAMENEKLYHQEELSLGKLAELLSITNHQLSQYLNVHLNKNFYSFIYEYRVNEAKDLLLNDEELTITHIAYRVGFNSISVFNRAFKKFTDKTPREFRQNR